MSLPTVATLIGEVLKIIRDTSFVVPKMWSPETVFVYGDIVRPTSGAYVAKTYVCQASGISGTTEPSWPVSGTVADSGITWAYSATISAAIASVILGYINEECHRVSQEVLLPPLETSSTIATVTTANYVSMPADYHRNMYAVYNSTDEYWLDERYIYRDYGKFIVVYPELDTAGDVVACCIKDGVFHYRFRPDAATSLVPYYYKRVTPLTLMTESPVCFPDHLLDGQVEELITTGVITQILLQIYRTNKSSDGMIQEYEGRRAAALRQLMVSIKTETPIHPRFAKFIP